MFAGLTGGIGSGKSTVARVFELLGCPIFESDRIARDIYFDIEVKPKVIALLGKQAYLSESSVDKAYISSKIFSDTLLLHQLNAIIHPVVINRSKEFAKKHPGKIVIKETALLFEAHLEKEVDTIILVVANDETRISRVMERDASSREEVLRKIKTQLPQEEKMKRADFIIYNDETRLLIPQVLKIYNTLLEKKHA